MQKGQLIKGTLGALVLLLLIYAYFNTERYNQYDWNEKYEKESKSPYGNYMIYELLKSYSGKENFTVLDEPLGATLLDSSLVGTNYVFKGLNSYYNYGDLKVLSEYVNRGNNVFILSNDDNFGLIYHMTESIDGSLFSFEDSVAYLGILDPDTVLMDVTKVNFIVNWRPTLYDWNYIEFWSEYEDVGTEELTVLGKYTNGDINFIKVSHGEGHFYYHTTPIAFSNYYLKEEEGFEYAKNVFNFMEGQKIFWDDFNHTPNQQESGPKSNPLQYIMSQPPLRWAWYLLLAIGLIYLLFYTRRKERVIPVLATNHNTSIEFIETISSLYMQPNGNFKIVRHKKNLFLDYIRNHYFVSTKEIDEDFFKTVSLKSGIGKDKIERIIKEGDRLEFISEVSDENLISYHRLTEYFYQNCK
ncbi:MAG: hypothetical protein ABJF11_03425 [Reichenbachiella sp.]|uniref:hypothetical protein n=1 Tax=Reichenbachiella sp. TaxID=2184521 RepID=UPI0032672949